MLFTTATLAALIGAAAAKDGRTFAVLHHHNSPLTIGRADPVVSPGQISAHVHTILGASNFGLSSTGDDLAKSSCTTAKIKGDLSAYWFPALYFQDPKDGHFEPVELFYMNVYYFFEGTNDQIKAFPKGLKMVSGDAMRRDPPNTDGSQNLDPSQGPVNPLQWTCPRDNRNFDPPNWPAGSDGTKAGIQSKNNKGSGIGFPFMNCDGYASPLRMDLHFPSCYNPAAGLENYKENMAFPSSTGNNKQDCPAGWIHVPHIFFEVYWNTPKFVGRWKENSGSQPFVLANGDRTGYSGHGDMIAGWDEEVLQQIIDNCDAGDSGMDKCPGLLGGINDDVPDCEIPSPVNEVVSGNLTKLPGNNPVTGWGLGSVPAMDAGASAPAASAPAASSSAAGSSKPASSSSKAASTKAASTKTTAINQVKEPKPTTSAAATAPAPPAVPSPDTTSPAGGDDSKPTDAPAAASTSSDSTSTIWSTLTEWATTTVDFPTSTPSSSPTSAPTTNTTLPSTNATSLAGFQYAGCYRDTRDRVLSGEIRPNLGQITNTLCITYCKSKGWSLAGTEYGGQCYCGNSLTGSELLADDDAAECDIPCEGDEKETCGGGWALSLYSADGTASVTATKKTRRHMHGHLARHRSGPSARRG